MLRRRCRSPEYLYLSTKALRRTLSSTSLTVPLDTPTINSTLPTKSVNAAMSTSPPTNRNDMLQSSRSNVHHSYRALPSLVLSSTVACIGVSQERHTGRIHDTRDAVKRKGEIKEAFEIVLKKWSDMLNEPGFNREQVDKYCNDWRKLSKDFDSIALGTSKMAAQGAAVIKDFSDSFSHLPGDDKISTIQQKQDQLANFKEKLLGEKDREEFEIGEDNMYALAQKITCHKKDLQDFEFSMQMCDILENPEMSDDIRTLKAKIKKLQNEVTKMKRENSHQAQIASAISVLAVLPVDISHAAPNSGKVGANDVSRQAERRRRLMQSIQEHETTLKQKLDTENSRRKKVWEDHLQSCEKQIASISDHLSAVVTVWNALCSDAAELNTELESVASKGLHEDLFRRRLETTVGMYTRLYEILSEFAKKPSTQRRPKWRIPPLAS